MNVKMADSNTNLATLSVAERFHLDLLLSPLFILDS